MLSEEQKLDIHMELVTTNVSNIFYGGKWTMCIKSVLSIISNLVEIDPKRLVKYRTYKNMSLLTHNSNTSVSYIHLLEFESKRKRERKADT